MVEINPVAKTEMKELSALNGGEKVGKVPVVVLQKADGSTELLKESSDIIDHLVAAQGATSAGDAQEQARWREWVDERWVRVVTVNIYRTLGESLQTFEYMTTLGKFSALEKFYVRYGGGLLMFMVAKKMRGKYKIAEEKGSDPRTALYAAAAEWTEALAGRPFLGGDAPGLADLGVYGVLQAVRGMDTFTELLETDESMAAWYGRMGECVGAPSRLTPDGVSARRKHPTSGRSFLPHESLRLVVACRRNMSIHEVGNLVDHCRTG